MASSEGTPVVLIFADGTREAMSSMWRRSLLGESAAFTPELMKRSLVILEAVAYELDGVRYPVLPEWEHYR